MQQQLLNKSAAIF